MRGELLLILSLCLSPFAHGLEPSAGSTKLIAAETVVLPKSVPDPIEPFNRVMWGFNKAVMTGVIKPTSRVYRFVVVKPIRTGIGNFGRNLTYPGRLINNLLQGKWNGARDESYRFVCNTTVGVAGVWGGGTRWDSPESDTDFGARIGPGARDESYRFVCNTTVGVAGFWDVGTRWNIPKSDTDFGQTFGQWGWRPQFFIMLPILGPSNERDTIGFPPDTA